MIVRHATTADVVAMTDILNAVIALGGTIAHEKPKTETEVLAEYIVGADVLSSVVCEDAGVVVGWQSVEMWDGDPHIGSFVRPGLQAKGAGRQMFALTQTTHRDAGVA